MSAKFAGNYIFYVSSKGNLFGGKWEDQVTGTRTKISMKNNSNVAPTENTVMDLLLDCQVIFIDNAVQTSNSSEKNTHTAKY